MKQSQILGVEQNLDNSRKICTECGFIAIKDDLDGLDCVVIDNKVYCGYSSNRDTTQYKFNKEKYKKKYKEKDIICDKCMTKMVRKKTIKRLYITEYDICYECDKEIDVIDKSYCITKGKLYINLHNYKSISNLKNTSDEYSLCESCFSDKILKS